MTAEIALDIPTCSYEQTIALGRDLGVSPAVAQVLVRRGLGDVDAARSWLAADERHPPEAFAAIDEAVAPALAACRAGRRITVHGDYDVDGVASTAVLVRALRSIGAEVDWFLPSRTEDGYGLSVATVDRLADRGTGLLLLSDCGITAAAEIAHARRRGLPVVVVDHHRPPADGVLPDAPIVHPLVGGYPCAHLCATAVAYKFAGALLAAAGHDAAIGDADLDLVALATVADCVPLEGENRRLVRAGLRVLARTEKPGLRALMAVCDVDPQRVTERELGFRLAPRLNAAGRVARADAALELLLTHDRERAAQIAAELDRVNTQRRFEETRILHEADAQLRSLGDRPAYVLWGEGWHPGVVGIVASRLAERHHRPVLVVAVDGERGTGSGRSIDAFDLHAALSACAPLLARFGGHRAAAGCTVAAADLPELRERFTTFAAATLTEADLVVCERVDAVLSGDELDYALAEELERLAPFGTGNPPPSLFLPAARLVDARPIGDGRHQRFTVESGGARAQGVAFGRTSLPPQAATGELAATFRLELNEFRGAVTPQLVLRALAPVPYAPPALTGEPEPGTPAWAMAVLAQARAGVREPVAAGGGVVAHPAAAPAGEDDRVPAFGDLPARDRRGAGTAGTVAALVASGEPVLVVCANAVARLDRFRGRIGGFELCSWDALCDDPGIADGARHLVAFDPPLCAAHLRTLSGLSERLAVHLAWGEAELRFSQDAVDRDLPGRGPLAEAYRALRRGAPLTEIFGSMPARRAARMLALFVELGLAELDEQAATLAGDGGRVDLAGSQILAAATVEHEERVSWLSRIARIPVGARAA